MEGLETTRVWDNHGVTEADQVPDRFLVLGGGAVGCEMAQAYRRLRAQVTIIQRSDRLLCPYELGSA